MFTLFLDQLIAWYGFICPVHGRVEELKNSGLCRNQPKNIDLVSEKIFVGLGGSNRNIVTNQYWRGFRCDDYVTIVWMWRFEIVTSATNTPKPTPIIQNYTHDE